VSHWLSDQSLRARFPGGLRRSTCASASPPDVAQRDKSSGCAAALVRPETASRASPYGRTTMMCWSPTWLVALSSIKTALRSSASRSPIAAMRVKSFPKLVFRANAVMLSTLKRHQRITIQDFLEKSLWRQPLHDAIRVIFCRCRVHVDVV